MHRLMLACSQSGQDCSFNASSWCSHCVTALFFPWASPHNRKVLFDLSTRLRAAFLRQKALEKPHPSLCHVSHHLWHIPELISLVIPVSQNLHSDTYTSAGDIACWGSLCVSYLFCHFEPLQQSHKFLLEVWLLKQKEGRKERSAKLSNHVPSSLTYRPQLFSLTCCPEVQGQL